MRTHMPLVAGAILGASAAVIITTLTLVKKNKKIFATGTMLHLLGAALAGAALGTSGYLLDRGAVAPDVLFVLLEIGVVALGAVHVVLLYPLNRWSRRERFLPEFGFTLLLALLGAVFFGLTYHWLGVAPFALLFGSAFCLFPLAFLVVKALDSWLAIPGKAYRHLALSPDKPPPVIRQTDQYLDLVFHIPIHSQTPEVAEFDIRSPLDSSLSDLFHYLIYRHNEQEKLDPRIPGIEIAEDNRRDKLYGWLFFTQKYNGREYIDPWQEVRTVLGNTTHIFVERVKP
ncbi:MAG: hypothetical protein ICV83_11970 [Cytophagales bacterium]|nr:hypothetical protein [Cytophagales bacterium]